MAGVLHPVGPQPARTYWLRRLLVAAVVALVISVVVALTTGSGTASVTAAPAQTTTAPAPAAAPPVGSPGAAGAATGPTQGSSTPPPTSVTSSARAKASAQAKAKAKAKAAAQARAKSRARGAAKAIPPTCQPSQLRATLTGKRQVRPGQGTAFSLSLINGSKAACAVAVTSDNFELKIYSGLDRIWSTKDCTRAIRPIRRVVGSEQAVEWRQRWDGSRSRKDCRDRPETPQAGTYFATAQLAGAKPVQLRMLVRG